MSLNLLVVEDSSVMRAIIIKTLQMADVEFGQIHQAANGLEGLGIMEREWVDMILTDINMPEMNGEEMILKVRENPLWQSLPVAVVSTEGSKTRIRRLEKLGVTFIHKPFTPEQMCGLIKDMVGVAG